MRLLSALDSFVAGSTPAGRRAELLVAFSGGPDSTALLWGLAQLRAARRFGLTAGHVDHALDPGSARRAERARAICERLGVPITIVRRPVPSELIRRGGTEAASRRIRYTALEQMRRARGATVLLTAHHRDDQVETVLLRLLQGSGWEGLAGIRVCAGPLGRPLLELTRSELREVIAHAGLEPVADPSNRDLRPRRNQLRHELVPYLVGRWPGLEQRCVQVAAAAADARATIERRLAERLGPAVSPRGASLDLGALRALPASLLTPALALLHRTAGAEYPAPAAAVSELARQLAIGARIGSDCGSHWRWEATGNRLELTRRTNPTPRFTYTLDVPGVVSLAEVSLRLRIERAPVAAWMFKGLPTKTGLGPALREGDAVVVRNRRPGDRLRPLGCSYTRRLKEVLIDSQIPRAERDRLPLLCIGGSIAWVPGVTIDEAYRIGEDDRVWVAELEPA